MSEETEKENGKPYEGNGNKLIEITPLKLLAVILKVVLTDRITDEEIEKICSTYYKTLQEWWD